MVSEGFPSRIYTRKQEMQKCHLQSFESYDEISFVLQSVIHPEVRDMQSRLDSMFSFLFMCGFT